eukprot:3548690-Amphidinium_carterae.1
MVLSRVDNSTYQDGVVGYTFGEKSAFGDDPYDCAGSIRDVTIECRPLPTAADSGCGSNKR